MAISDAILLGSTVEPKQTKLVQLYNHVELLSEGDPPANSLFVLGRAAGSSIVAGTGEPDQLLIVDPPADIATRFRQPGPVAVIYTGEVHNAGLPLMKTVPGGTAHIRLGEHYVDIYSQRYHSVVHLPALGLLCSGAFGSDSALPLLADESDGEQELQTLLLLAKLVKQHRMQLFIPHTGGYTADNSVALARLADDVAYLHSLRRIIPPLALQVDPLDVVMDAAATLLPTERSGAAAQAAHRVNITRLYQFCLPPESLAE
jgi:hypothetical protein